MDKTGKTRDEKIEQPPKHKEGYITFLDILGWKGIWKDKNDDEIAQLIKSLLNIRKECQTFINNLQFEYILGLTKKDLSGFYEKDEKQNELNKLVNDNSNYNELVRLGETPNIEIRSEIGELSVNIQELQTTLALLEEQKDSPLKSTFVEHSESIINFISTFRDRRDELNKKYFSYKSKFDVAYAPFKINISIELISDTFVITSESLNKEYELFMHTNIVKALIGECLKNDMLIRGATSYGDYFTEDKIFVGSAVDDAASWHEQGDEIGVFFTPKGYIATEKEIAQKCLDEKLLRIKKTISKKQISFI